MRSRKLKKPWKRSFDHVDDDNRRPKFQPSFKRRRVEGFKKFRDCHAFDSEIRGRSGAPLKHLNYGSRNYHAPCRGFNDGDRRLASKEKFADGVPLRHGADLGELKSSSQQSLSRSWVRRASEGREKVSFPQEVSQQSCLWERRASEGREKVSIPRYISLQDVEVEPKPSIDRGRDRSLMQENAFRSPANHKGDAFHTPRSRFNDSDQRLAYKAKSNDVAIEAPLKLGDASGKLKSSSQQSLSPSWERRPSEGWKKVSFPWNITLQDVVSQKSKVEPKPSIGTGRDRSLVNEEQIRWDMVGLKVPKNIQQENALRSPANHRSDPFHAPRSRFNDSDWRLAFKDKSNDVAIEVPLKHGAVSGKLNSSSQQSVLPSWERQPSEGRKKVSFHPEISFKDVVSQKSQVEPKPLIGTGLDCSLENEVQIGRDMVGLKVPKNILQENALKVPANHKGDAFQDFSYCHAFKCWKVDDSGQEMTTSEAKLDGVAENRVWLRRVSDLDTLRTSSQKDVSSSPIYASQSGACVKQDFNVEQKPAIAVTCSHSVEIAANERAMTSTKVPKNVVRQNSLKCHAPSGDLVSEKSNAATLKNMVDSHDRIIEVTTEVKRMIGSKNTSENSSKCQREPSHVLIGDLRHQDDEKTVRILEENEKGKIAAEEIDAVRQVTDCEAIPGNCGHQEQVRFQHLFSEKIIVVNSQGEARVSEQTVNNDEQRCFFYVADNGVADDRIQKLKQLKDDCVVLISDRYRVHDSRRRVVKALDLFNDVYTIRFKAYKAEQTHGSPIQKIDVRTAMALKHEQKWVNSERAFVGNVPGVYIGDQFRFRAELSVVGLHQTFCPGIHYVKIQGKNYAISIVNSGRYKNQSISPNSFIYAGHGGNPSIDGKEPVDQELKYGNLALKNSRDKGVPVRVIRVCQLQHEDSGTNTKRYIYEGLFVVTRYWQETTQHGTMAFMFELHRMPNQPSCTPKMSVRPRMVGGWYHRRPMFLNGKRTCGVFKRSLRCERVVVDDVSCGKENIAIRVVSDIYAERPPPFTYTANMIYPDWYHPSVPLGCDCTNGCSDSRHCFCAYRNGGEIPYNSRGAIIKPKPVIYECGPACKCPPCRNRVSQHGIRYHLEIFRKKPSGWGVRSRDYISSGSFICEFAGELIDKEEAEQRSGHLQYFCPIAKPHHSCTAIAHLPEDSSSQHKYSDGYIIDATCSGNVARFINRSSSLPNLYVQNVLYEDDFERVPHIMLFACKNIPPMLEFTYDYNCSDQSDASSIWG